MKSNADREKTHRILELFFRRNRAHVPGAVIPYLPFSFPVVLAQDDQGLRNYDVEVCMN